MFHFMVAGLKICSWSLLLHLCKQLPHEIKKVASQQKFISGCEDCIYLSIINSYLHAWILIHIDYLKYTPDRISTIISGSNTKKNVKSYVRGV